LIYAVGDIHGRYDLFKMMLGTILADIAERAAERLAVVVLLGDYVDRGPQSAEVLEALVELKRRGQLRLHLLRGNHEQAMLRFLSDPVRSAPWIGFGGAQTLQSYGVEVPGPAPRALITARDALLEAMPSSHLRLLEQLELMLVIGDYAFVHAGVRAGTPLRQQTEEDLLWIRDDFLKAPGRFEKIIVHGHTWSGDQPQLLEHRIGLDTGAYSTGVLTAARLDGADAEILQARIDTPALVEAV
jgi:serine/threonine protein phosphatase 1